MNRTASLAVLGIIAVVAIVVIWLFASGGGPSSTEDASGDVVVSKGGKAPREVGLADVTAASVSYDDGVVFEARVDGDLPQSFKREGITFRWDIQEGGRLAWIVTVDVNVDSIASVVATGFDYRSSTVDDSLPGTLEIDGDRVRLTLDPQEIERFPDTFEWTLTTSLDGDLADTGSAEASDVVPDEGSLRAAS